MVRSRTGRGPAIHDFDRCKDVYWEVGFGPLCIRNRDETALPDKVIDLLVRDQEVVGSNPVVSTCKWFKNKELRRAVWCKSLV